MKISELATRSGLPPSTLRYYEAEGLLTADRTANGYRTYGQTAVDRLAFITQAKTLDLSLTDIRELLTAWESEPCSGVRAVYRPVLKERAAEVHHRVAALGALLGTLTQAVAQLDALPDRDAPCDAGCAFLGADEPASPPLVCSLDGGSDYADRIASWHQLLVDTQPVPVGSSIQVTLPIEQLQQTAALAAAEQRCCAFIDFRIDLHSSTFELTITAPARAVDLLTDLLPPSGRHRFENGL